MGIPAHGQAHRHLGDRHQQARFRGPDAAARWQRFGAMQLMQQLGVIPRLGGASRGACGAAASDDARGRRPGEETRRSCSASLRSGTTGDYDVADEIFHPEAIAPDAPQLPRGPEGCREVAGSSGRHSRISRDDGQDVVAEDDLVVCRFPADRNAHRG